MRPEPPARYHRSVFERSWRRFRPTLVTRMILRNLERQPVRTVHVGRRHRVRRRGAAGRPRVHRRPEPVDGSAVHDGDAAGRDGDVRRAAVGARPARRRASAGRDGSRADAQRGGSLPRRSTDAHARDHRACPRRRISTAYSIATAARCRCRPTAWCCPGCSATSSTSSRARRCRWRSWKARRPVHDLPVAALVDDSLGLQAYMRIDACNGCCTKADAQRRGADARPGRGRSLLCDGQAGAGGGRRGDARRRPPELS